MISNVKTTNLKLLQFLSLYENRNISFKDLNQIFRYDEIIDVLVNSPLSYDLTQLLKNMDLPEDFQSYIDEKLSPNLELSVYEEYMSLISDHIVLDILSNVEDICIADNANLFKTDEARIEALNLKIIKNESSNAVRILASFQDDSLKLKYLHLIDKYDYDTVFSSIEDDKVKEKIIEKYPNNCSYLIANLENEEMRIYYYERNFKKLDSNSKRIIFNSFSEENKEKFLDRYWKGLSESEKTAQLSLLKSEESILKRVNLLPSDVIKIRLINNLEPQNLDLINEIKKTITYDNSKRLIKKLSKEGITYSISYLDVNKLFSKYSDREKIKYIESQSPETDTLLPLLATMHEFKNIEKFINHHDELPSYDEKYNSLITRYAENYNLNPEHLLKTVKIFGFEILKSAKVDRLQKIINLDDVSFEKTMQLFDADKYKMDNATLNDNVNIFLQRKFKLQNPQIINVNSEIRLAIQTEKKEEALTLIDKIVDEYNINDILKKYNYTMEQFITELLNNTTPEANVSNCLFEITNGYIVHKRNEFIQNNITKSYKMFAKECYDPKEVLKFVVENYPSSMIRKAIFDPNMITNRRGFSQEEVDFVNHPNAVETIIKFKRNPAQYQTVPSEIKKYMSVFNKLFEENFEHRININMTGADIKKIYTPISYINQDMLRDALLTLDPDILQKGILNDPKIYDSLSNILEKYKLFGFNDSMQSAFPAVGLDASGYTVGYLINYFSVIHQELSDKIKRGEIKNITLPNLLDMAQCYSFDSDKLSILFGKDNIRLLASNPGPNSASMSKEQRLEKAQQYLKTMYKRTTISVPSYDQDFELKNNKKINIVVGNVSDPINLTYGERTGACMRIGGQADSLFDFCLTNENGFHIRFTNPENDKFVSRVSGFRNGNTVFLNELRYSEDVCYTNEEIKEACMLAAKELIDKSKDSSYPIENVVISPEYVMEKAEKVDLNVPDIKKGLRSFYSDVNRQNATILVTTNPDNSLVPIKIGNNKSATYQTQRGKIRMYSGEHSYEQLSRLEMLDQILSGTKIEDTIITSKQDIIVAYCGEDWYVTVNKDGVINEFMMKNSNKKSHAMMEKEECMQRVTAQLGFSVSINEDQIVNNMGGIRK